MKKDKGLGANYIELAAKQGYDKAPLAVGGIYLNHQKPEKARPWLEKADAQGNQKAQELIEKLNKF